MSRPTKAQWAMSLAAETAKRSTCLRRSVGCVLLDARGHVLSTGYNGVAAGLPHCNEGVEGDYTLKTSMSSLTFQGTLGEMKLISSRPPTTEMVRAVSYQHACEGAESKSGMNLDGCQAIHAEQNALLQCRDVYSILTCYVTTSPCLTCIKLLLNTGCEQIVFNEPYTQEGPQALWETAGRLWTRAET